MIDNTYGEFADYFDYLNGDAQYNKRTKYILELFEEFGTRPQILLDKTTPRLIQFHTLKNAANPPFLGGFLIFDTVAA